MRAPLATGTPRVSVVLPTRNRAGSLGTAVASVLAQSVTDLELIVVDDASEDGTSELLDGIADPRLVRVRLPRHSGAAAARNAGLRVAQADLVAFQDSDDEWLPDKLGRQIELLDANAALGAVGGRYRIETESGSLRVVAPQLESGAGYEDELLAGPCCITPVWLVRRSLVEELDHFDERMPCLEDWDFMLRLSQRTELRAVSTEVLVKRGVGDSLGADVERRAPAIEELLRRYGQRFLARPRRHAALCLELSYLWLVSRRPGRALHYGARALRHRGASARMLVAFVRACVRALLSGQALWPVPGLSGDE